MVWGIRVAFLLGTVLLMLLIVIGVRLFVRRWRAMLLKVVRSGEHEPRLCEHCGYDLTGIVIPHCPECGRALGFDKSLAELGLSADEVLEYRRRREAELRGKQ